MEKELKSGIVVLLGRSNTGKSTLLNNLVGTKVAITTPKPQTTRNPIQGVLHDERGQIVFVDTPGIFQKRHDVLTKKLTQKAKESLKDVDLVLYIADPTRDIGPEEKTVFHLVKNLKIPKILVINKIDLEKKPFLEDYEEWEKYFNGKIEISAYKKKNLKALVNLIFEYLKEGAPYYPEYQLTNITNQFWFAELIREKIFLLLYEEIPYSTHVEIEEITDKKNILYVRAIILTTKLGYRKIIIGHQGKKIKEIGVLARKEMEQAVNKKIFLDLEVKVEKKWPERFI